MPINILYKTLEGQNPISISKINWWLLKYSNLQKRILHFIDSKKELIELENGLVAHISLLDDSTYNSYKKFLNLYYALKTISEFQINEKYFEQEMNIYHGIKSSKKDLKNWVAKNEYFGTEIYACFIIDYLDYSENPENLNVYVHSSKELDLYIDRQDFKNTIDFIEIFNKLYYLDQILPKSIEKIRIKMSKIKTIINNSPT